jgi:hypothetical protein
MGRLPAKPLRDAQAMSADLIDNYARLPWHRYACDYLAGRTVPLRFSEASPARSD